jgi:paraquat-inducible protein A
MQREFDIKTCPDCAAVYDNRLLNRGEELVCCRCGNRLKKYYDRSLFQKAWALVTLCLIALFMANITPIMVFDVSGNTQSNLIVTGVLSLFFQGYWPLAILVFCAAILLPLLHLVAFWYLLASCCFQQRWRGSLTALHAVNALARWNMMPVFAVATMAAVVKLEQLGTIEWRVGALWVALLALSSLLAMRLFDYGAILEFFSVTS